ncbi:acyltransferase family protein [Calothrix sp. UHCC 0171]|uniref:acyltransferase family protein n=1 Tax=Calothrix sp. UHCC 0171 TaxID=3110245 RepID=UPI002B20B506|nr:acyltransferase family protein [Calothrix sp. UHCC 0171]MEA5569887.1 acyltransferase family protein [Calothrix sp. UHCC 0171]
MYISPNIPISHTVFPREEPQQNYHLLTTSSQTRIYKMRIYSNQSRLFCLDFLKAVSILAIVSYNSIFFPVSTYQRHADFLEILFTPFRFCIPVFFTITFFFLVRQLEQPGNTNKLTLLLQQLRGILIPTIFWFTIAAVFKVVGGASIIEISRAIYQGKIFPDSYYLLVILQLLPIYYLLRRWLHSSYSLIMLVVLQWLIFLLLYTILTSVSAQGITEQLKNLNRPLIIYWLVYVGLGLLLYRKFNTIESISTWTTLSSKVFLLCLMSIIFMFDYQWLLQITNSILQPFDYATISCLISVFVMFLCFTSIQETQFSVPIEFLIKLISKYSLGIFCINGILSQLFSSVSRKLFEGLSFSLIEILLIKIMTWMLLLMLSLGVSVLLARFGLKRMVCD